MFDDERLSTNLIQDLFAEEVAAGGGCVSDAFNDGRRFFARSVFPWVREVRHQDKLQGGVALRATEREACVHPYVFRQVCRNGAIMAHALQSQHIEGLSDLPLEEAAERVREAVQACCVEEAFDTAVGEIRFAGQNEADMALMLLPFINRLPPDARTQILGDIMGRFFGEEDRTQFGLMNAVTSLARDTRDPELRWRLEELGGGIPACRTPPTPDEPSSSRAVLVG